MEIPADFPAKALPLFMPCAYKVMHGGRGGAKSWAAARALLILGAKKKLFILCAREIQKSINESVYKLLCDQIRAMGLGKRLQADGFDNHQCEDGHPYRLCWGSK